VIDMLATEDELWMLFPKGLWMDPRDWKGRGAYAIGIDVTDSRSSRLQECVSMCRMTLARWVSRVFTLGLFFSFILYHLV